MSQAIKYEATTIEPEQSAAEIMRLARYGVGWKTYRDARLEGAWNEAAEVMFPGRDEFRVEGERRNGRSGNV